MRTAPVMLLLLALSGSGCAIPDENVATAEAAQTAGTCGFIPGCIHLDEAANGPFSASVMEHAAAGGSARTLLSVNYREDPSSNFLMCQRPASEQKVSLVFVTGPTDARVVLTRSMAIACPSQWGDNGGQPNRASFHVAKDEDPALWNALFPARPDGSRWYALQVAATNAQNAWDSRYGQNYALVMKPRGTP